MKVSSILLIAVGVPVMVSCRIMPIQMIRVSQSETFVQTFEFAKGKENQGKALDILEKQIGERNLDVLKNNYDRKDNTASLVNGLFEARGNINVNLSIAPKDHTTFFVDGNGRYFIVNKLKGHILYTSDFNLVPKPYDLRLLTVNREIVIEFNQQLINHFILPTKKGDSFGEENWNFEYNRNIAIHVRINQVFPRKEIYSVDYEARHKVMIDNTLVGYMVFDRPVDPFDKIIDLRGLRLLRNDYRKLSVH